MSVAPPNISLSVVIPTLGRPILIDTLKSLLAAQGAAGMEIIVAGRIADPVIAAQVKALVAANPCLRQLEVAFPTGDSSRKKTAGLEVSRAGIVAFIDDDVVVAPDWPLRIVEPFADPAVGLVSGPSLVPDGVPLMTRLAGITLASKAAGYVAQRYMQGDPRPRQVRWSYLIGCNMAFRKSVLDALGGFDPTFWPGEEMIAAFQATRAGQILVFHPKAYLYHYPRASLYRYVKQIYGYGATRIRLTRAGVEFEPTTLIPALWVLSLLVLGVTAPFCRICLWLLAANLAVYLASVLYITADKVRETRRWRDALMFLLVPLMHVSYGLAEWVEVVRPGRDLSVKKG
jgi:GT2 family glycosyltransferase